jgi:hypothetical protein
MGSQSQDIGSKPNQPGKHGTQSPQRPNDRPTPQSGQDKGKDQGQDKGQGQGGQIGNKGDQPSRPA